MNFNKPLSAADERQLANRPWGTKIVIVNKSNSNTMGAYEDYKDAVKAYNNAPFPALLTISYVFDKS
jgi:hypothetical protein